jgi:hypothetical protein
MKLSLFSTALAAVMLSSVGHAQTTVARGYIPFAFQVGETTLPAGNYQVQDSQNLVKILQLDGSKGVFHLAMQASRSHQTSDATLVFKRYGNTFYLTTIWNAGSTEGRTLIPGKREKALAKRSQSFEMAEVTLPTATP